MNAKKRYKFRKRTVKPFNRNRTIFSAETTARMILTRQTIRFNTEGEDFFNYVWHRFGGEVYRAVISILGEQLPGFLLGQMLRNVVLRHMEFQTEINFAHGPPEPQELAVNQQFFVPPFPPRFPPNSPNPQMGSPGNNVRGYGRHPWPSFQKNYYPYDRKRRSHLDDIYLPNYEEEDLEDKPDFREQQLYNNRFHWYTKRSDQRNAYNRPSFVKRSQLRSTAHNNTKEPKTNNNSALKVEDAANSFVGADENKNCDRKKSEMDKAVEVNVKKENIKKDESVVKDRDNSAKECRVEKNDRKTERCNLGDVTNSVSCEQDKSKMTEDSKSKAITSREESNSAKENETSVPEGQSGPEAHRWYPEDSSPKVTEASSQDDSDYPYSFITLDNIDTTRSYLEPSFLVLDNYVVEDMDISPMKRKNGSDREDGTPKKTKYDSLYFGINSERLLGEAHEVLRGNGDTSGSSRTIKRFRSKSLTLEDTSMESTPLVRSGSLGPIDKNKFQAAYFDVKTKDDGSKESSTRREIILSENPIVSTENDGSTDGANAIIDSNVAREVEILTDDHHEASNNQLERTRKEPGIVIIEDVQLKPPTTNESNRKEETEKSTEETNTTLGSSKRKCYDSNEEQPKKKCLDPVVTSIETGVAKKDSTDAIDTTGCVEFILEDDSCDISLDNVQLNNRSLTRGSQGSESLADIEAELKSLLSVDTTSKIREKITSNSIDEKTGSKERTRAAGTSCTESKQSGDSKEHSRKGEIQSRNDKSDLKKNADPRKGRASISKLKDKPLKKHTGAKNRQNSDIFVHRKTTTSTSQRSLKSVGASQKPQVKESTTKSKPISYYEHFNRIRSLFGSDSESEMEEGKMTDPLTKKNEKQAMNRADITNTAQESAPTYTNFKTDPKPLSLKELSKAIEKRRRSAPVTDLISPLKLPEESRRTHPTVSKCEHGVSTISKPKRIEKRRETLPASLIRGLSKNGKLVRFENGIQKSNKGRIEKEKTDEACIINPKLKDPPKDLRYKSLEEEKQRNESTGAKKPTNRQNVAPNSHETQAKTVEKTKHHQDSEKKDVSPQKTMVKMDRRVKKKNNCGNMTRNDKENAKENPLADQIVRQVQPPTKSPKTDQSAVQAVIESKIKNSRQETPQLKLQFCLALSRDRFPLLQRADSLVQENECCDRATTLDSVDVSDKVIAMRQVTEQEDDIIEVRQEIPVIDLTCDSVNDNKPSPKVETKEEKPAITAIADRCEDMITLYRSEETVNRSLDVQATSESISPSVLFNNQTKNSKNVQVYNNNNPQRADNCDTTPPTINPAAYIRSLCNKVVPAPLARQFPSTNNVCEVQLTNRLASDSFATSPSTVLQTSRSSEAYNSDNLPTPPVPNQRRTAAGNNVQINLHPDYEPGQEEITNRVNLAPPVRQLAATVQQNVSPWRTVNHNLISQQHPLLYRQITMNSENRPSNPRVNSYEGVVHNPMRHGNEEGPAPLHEINSQEMKSTGLVLVKYLLLLESFKEAQCAYKNNLLKIQRHMPVTIRSHVFHFETYAFARNLKLYKDLLKELKGLSLTGSSSRVKSAELLMNQTFRALQPMVADLTLWRVYLMLDSLMQPEAVEYIAVPFLRDLYSYVSFVAGRIRGRPGAGPLGNPQGAVPPRDLFTQEQRVLLHWQIKQYNLIRSAQDSLTKRLRSSVRRRPSNGTIPVPQIMQQPPSCHSRRKSTVPTSYVNTSPGKSCPKATVHQNIVIRPVETTNVNVPATLNACKPVGNQKARVLSDNDTFRIQLPCSCPNNDPSTTRILSEGNVSQANENIAFPVAKSPVLVHSASSPSTEPDVAANKPVNDSTAIEPLGTESNTLPDGITVKEEEKKPGPLLTEQEIETIDLTWIDDIDPEQLESEMEFIPSHNLKKEEQVEEEDDLNEEPFAVAPSPADSGISSPPIQVEYDETVFSNRSCICGRVAEYVCGCMMAMYCSVKCQAEDWRAHKEVCQKYKIKNGKDSKK